MNTVRIIMMDARMDRAKRASERFLFTLANTSGAGNRTRGSQSTRYLLGWSLRGLIGSNPYFTLPLSICTEWL